MEEVKNRVEGLPQMEAELARLRAAHDALAADKARRHPRAIFS